MIKAVIFDYRGVVKNHLSLWGGLGSVYNISEETAKEKIKPLFV